MLHRRSDLRRVEAAALHSADVGRAQRRREQRRLGPGLVVAAPPVVTGEVLHRREVPVSAGRKQLLPRRGTGRLGQVRVPRRPHPDRLREERGLERVTEPVHGVDAVDDRNVQAGVFDRVALNRVVLLGPAPPGVVDRVIGATREDRPRVEVDQHPLQTDRLERVVVSVRVVAVAVCRRSCVAQLPDHDLVHLADLLLQRHAPEQIVDAILDRSACVEVARLAGARRRRRRAERDGRERGNQHADHGECASHRSSFSSLCDAQKGDQAAPRTWFRAGCRNNDPSLETASGLPLLVASPGGLTPFGCYVNRVRPSPWAGGSQPSFPSRARSARLGCPRRSPRGGAGRRDRCDPRRAARSVRSGRSRGRRR